MYYTTLRYAYTIMSKTSYYHALWRIEHEVNGLQLTFDESLGDTAETSEEEEMVLDRETIPERVRLRHDTHVHRTPAQDTKQRTHQQL